MSFNKKRHNINEFKMSPADQMKGLTTYSKQVLL